MAIYHADIIQRSDAWWEIRCGKITATNFPTMANSKSKSTLDTLCFKTAAEILTGVPIENSYSNDAMETGIALEDEARRAYEIERLKHVLEVGFIEFDDMFGVSPDGLVDDDGLIEIKCPTAHVHLRYLNSKGKAWRAYRWQCQGGLFVSNRKYLDFVSYQPMFPPEKQLLIERVSPDPESFEKLKEGMAVCKKRIEEILAGVE
ncbi:MAG: YqaJ viral recombinase family protein [Phycisphaerae bacterium]|nr:YqaJ viral recombinase family protein [Phycisphaerae bacterium]